MPLVLRKLFRRRIVLAAAIALALVVAVSLLAGPLSGFDPNETAVSQRLHQPSAEHLLGTDELGRDLFARIAFGGRFSLTIALLTAIGSVLAGTLLGLVAGFFRRLDAPVMRVVDAMMSFPDILLAIALVGILGPSMLNVVLALVLVYTPRVARVERASTLVVRECFRQPGPVDARFVLLIVLVPRDDRERRAYRAASASGTPSALSIA